MTPYRREYNKLYNKINKLAQKGSDQVFDYYNLVDEVISNEQYSLLEDIMITKYKISIKNFQSISDFKSFSFEEIRKITNTSTAEALQRIFKNKSVYLVGYQVFNNDNNHYLGDIREQEETVNLPYRDRKIIELTTNVYAEVGIPSSVEVAIPPFENNPVLKINYQVGQHLSYIDNLYECIQSYTFSVSNRITPTYSSYWSQIKSPTYSRLDVTDDIISLVDKYSQAIDFLKGFTFSYV